MVLYNQIQLIENYKYMNMKVSKLKTPAYELLVIKKCIYLIILIGQIKVASLRGKFGLKFLKRFGPNSRLNMSMSCLSKYVYIKIPKK